MHQPRFGNAQSTPTCSQDPPHIVCTIIGQRITFRHDHHCGRKIAEIPGLQRRCARVMVRLCPAMAQPAIGHHIRRGQHRCLGMCDIAAPAAVATQPRIDQQLPDEGQLLAQGMGHRRRQRAPGRITAQHQRAIPFIRRGQGRGAGILKGGGMGMFRRQPVIDADQAIAGGRAKFGADIIMAVKPAHHEATAMKIHAGQRVAASFINPAGHPAQIAIRHLHPRGARFAKGRAHPVIDLALLGAL